MKLFISWSGQTSHKIAAILHEWIQIVLPHIKPYLSSFDIQKGERWLPEISSELDSSSFGIICVVPGNSNSTWLNFEAGALSKTIEGSRVCPFLVGVAPSDLPSTLSQFQCTEYDYEDVRKLLDSLNSASKDEKIEKEKLYSTYKICWPGLKERIDPIVQEISKTIDNTQIEELNNASASIDDDKQLSLNDSQIEILKYLANSKDQTEYTSQISDSLKMKVLLVKHGLEQLEKNGLIYIEEDPDPESEFSYLTSSGREYVISNNLLID